MLSSKKQGDNESMKNPITQRSSVEQSLMDNNNYMTSARGSARQKITFLKRNSQVQGSQNSPNSSQIGPNCSNYKIIRVNTFEMPLKKATDDREWQRPIIFIK